MVCGPEQQRSGPQTIHPRANKPPRPDRAGVYSPRHAKNHTPRWVTWTIVYAATVLVVAFTPLALSYH